MKLQASKLQEELKQLEKDIARFRYMARSCVQASDPREAQEMEDEATAASNKAHELRVIINQLDKNEAGAEALYARYQSRVSGSQVSA